MEKQSLSQKIIRNTFYNTIGHVWGILVVLILTPYVIHHIGIERYGIWVIIGVITGYFGLLDFGVGNVFVKYISEFYAKRDYEKINQVVNTGFVFYSAFAILIISLALFIIKLLLTFFKIPPYLYNEAQFVFLLGIILFAISNCLNVFRSIQSGLQRMDITNKVLIAASIPTVFGTIFFLKMGYGLPGLMVNNAIILGISGIADLIIAFKILPELKFNPFLFSKKVFKELFNFGYKLQIARMSSMISIHIDKLLISYFLSIGLVTFYQLGSSIVEKCKSTVLLFTGALMPAFSEMDAKGEKAKLIEGYARGTKYLALIAVPLFTFIIISAPDIMMIWMGPGYGISAWVIQILGVGWLCAVLSAMRSIILQAIARPDIEMKAGLVAAVLNIPLSIIFIVLFGFSGVVLGTSIALFFSVVYATIRLHKEIQLPIGRFLKTSVLKTVTICICIGLPLWISVTALKGVFFELSRIKSLIFFIIQAALFFGIYLKVLIYTKPFDGVDVMMFAEDKPSLIQDLMMKFSK